MLIRPEDSQCVSKFNKMCLSSNQVGPASTPAHTDHPESVSDMCRGTGESLALTGRHTHSDTTNDIRQGEESLRLSKSKSGELSTSATSKPIRKGNSISMKYTRMKEFYRKGLFPS